MAPKALTDCPENLREAIDWLVQVQHCGGVSTVSDALSTLFDNVAQDAEKSLPSLLDTDRPSARDVVSKLRAFQSTLPKNAENPNKNIIHNLCASACSLLGYRYPGTYDGSGIVYGNASRLCDAILAFLYAVFSDVHGNQPYVAGRSVLHDVIVQLKSQLWRGHKGFCQVIPKVATGLRDYNAAVKASNDRVKEPIETVLEYVKPDGELRNGIKALQVGDVTGDPDVEDPKVSKAVSLVEGCKEVARVFSKSLTAATDAINDLNPKLKRKLENARRSFFNHVDWLSKWSKKGQKARLDKMVQKIKSRHRRLAKAVKDKIKQEVHTVVELLKKRVRKIKMKLEGITASLGDYVKELGQWMDDAKKYIKDVKRYVDDIMKQLDGENRQAIDKTAADIDSELGKKVEELNKWIERADAAVKAAKDKAADVFKRLDKDDEGQKISQGIKQIEDAKKNVVKVDEGLKLVNDDLKKWREAAQIVLDLAVNRAENVHKALDPKESSSTLGSEIHKIDTARQGLVSANEQLGEQVKTLHKWIQDAEDIRHRAETKAKEAYDKLQVHEALSENVQKIVAAKNKIDEVNRNVTVQLGTLNQWNAEANKVLDGAIKNAEYVHDRLESTVVKKISEIENDNDSMKAASKTLESEVSNLGKWKDAAVEVIDKANKKCDEILKRVDKDHKGNQNKDGPVILKEATLLKNNGTKLLQAAKDAKQKVESKVKDALDAVKEMDAGLKEDLFEVRKKIKDGITKVITDLKVGELGDKVKEDLQKLRGNIEGLKRRVDERNGNGLVKKELDKLDEAKEEVNQKTHEIKEQKLKEMDEKFKESVQNPLNKQVEKVKAATEGLYNTVSGGTNGNGKNIKDVIDHIRDKVDNILTGENGRKDRGLKGIEKGLVESYAGGFKNDFERIVGGWVEDILGQKEKNRKLNENLKEWLEKYVEAKSGRSGTLRIDEALSKQIIGQVKDVLRSEISAAGKHVQNKISTISNRQDKIKQTITAVKAGCKKFVEGLDNKFKGTDGLVGVAKRINASQRGWNEEAHNFLNEITLIALRAVASQVADEIESILLGDYRVGNPANTSIAAELDRVIAVTQGLNDKLGEATNTKTSENGTAQAVDKAIDDVKTMVGGIEQKFEDVKTPVEQAVQGLDTAVQAYDKSAQEQVKAAARGAIDKAANEISDNGGSDVDLGSKMPQFSVLNKQIQDGLATQLKGLLDTHVGKDDTNSASGVPAGGVNSQSNRVTLADRMFAKYGTHITQPGDSSQDPTGSVPNAINSIKSDGLRALNDNGVGGILKKGNSIFDKPFETMEKEIKEIAELVSDQRQSSFGGLGPNRHSLKEFLKQLKNALGDGKLEGADKGLGEIGEAIGKLQKDPLSTKPKAIGQAVEAIRNEVGALKQKLKNSKGNDVITTLHYLKETGLGINNDWQPNGSGKSMSGIGKIRTDIEEQNKQLPKLTDEMDDAFNQIKRELMGVLGQVGMRLDNIFVRGDVMDNLKDLKLKIGRGENIGLERIQKFIKKLQEGQFTLKPEAIGKAKDAITEELKKLRSDLQNEVSSKLTDLVDKGFGPGDRWNGNAKGFENIQGNLKSQQGILFDQPEQIESGMSEITDELQSLRTELQGTGDDPKNRGVIHNLNFLITQLGEDESKGLKLISKQTESLKNSQVPLITKHLNSMSTEITTTAGNLGWNLNQLENPYIDVKLKGIETGLDKLQLTDLAEAIRLCDDFLSKADEIEKNTVQALWKHVDAEVDDVINDLTKEARALYVESVREALEMFARKVEGDLEQLPNEINRDRYMGYKGFMNTAEGVKGENINKLKCVESTDLRPLSAAFASFFSEVNDYVRKKIPRLHYEQNKEKNPLLPPTAEPYTPKLNDVYDALTALLTCLTDNDGGTDRLTELVERLIKALGNLAPTDFKHPSTPLLDTVARGLTKFAGEFHNTYISAYSGQRCREEYAHKYAKVLLSMIPMTHKALSKLATKCEGEWKALHITEFTADDRDNPLGNYLTRCGYGVSRNDAVQEGELRCDMLGGGIYELLISPIPEVAIEMHLGAKPLENEINLVTMVAFLYDLLCHYFQVCHIYVPLNPRYPCTVRDMLSWLSGLQYTQVADKLPGHCKALLNRRCHDGDIPNKDDTVMAKCIGEIPYAIASACSYSTALLIAIQGNGHGFDLAAYPYSVDFSNNRARLHYPNDLAELLEMLRKIAYRLCKVLYFLYSQCCRSTARVKGWRDCAYGRQVQSHNWQCNTFNVHSAASATSTTATATTTSSTTTHGCPPTSPLQSFLSDRCQGLLPHTLTYADGTIECANCLANQPGQQCLTPLGFWDLGFAASISGTGWDLAKRLGDMCRDADSCLFVLCRTLSLLCPTAPSSLADVFALYAQVLRQWDTHDRVNHRGGTYTDASGFISHLNTDGIDSLFPLWTQLHGSYDNRNLTSAIASLAGHDHKSHDALSTLFYDSTCQPPSGCAPYLQPLGLHAHHTYPRKHAGLYITWIMHLAWQLWELLTSLLHALDNIDCTASGCATCPCQPGTHGGKDTCHCPSIVQCAGPLPTLYRYGFTYRNADLLVTESRAIHCGDLNAQLKEALHADHFIELFRQIDQLIWHIRMPFLYCVIALWSLVALYILHTFLYRMDILRIRSHLLTSKASHLIEVKALLIPSRNMLSLYDASYFDDDPSELLDAT